MPVSASRLSHSLLESRDIGTGKSGQPRLRPAQLAAGKGCNFRELRSKRLQRRIGAEIANNIGKGDEKREVSSLVSASSAMW